MMTQRNVDDKCMSACDTYTVYTEKCLEAGFCFTNLLDQVFLDVSNGHTNTPAFMVVQSV